MSKKTWRLISDAPQTGAANMATDEAIAVAFSEGKVPPTLRLYSWSVPTFSIGAFQRLESAWVKQFEENTLSLVRRITGGRGLLHDSEMTYSVIASTKEPLFSLGIKGTFQSLAKGLLKGMEILGVNAAVYRPLRKDRRMRLKDPLCFSAPSWYEITAEGKKLIGSAQKRWLTYFLQHGSLMVEKRQITQMQNHPMKEFVSENQIALSEILPELPPHNRLIEALKSGFESALGIHFVLGEITSYEQRMTKQLTRTKYDNRRWNLYREDVD